MMGQRRQARPHFVNIWLCKGGGSTIATGRSKINMVNRVEIKADFFDDKKFEGEVREK